ncbi:MAG: hypothetical protein IT532_12380 [Burkholderiales bacterium]|nr:hypothetical protein [Burkholderiales bacterium]
MSRGNEARHLMCRHRSGMLSTELLRFEFDASIGNPRQVRNALVALGQRAHSRE